ncbi:MAG: type II secretion system protein [Candidatus Andersenbacteria bacterium]|nr:type II secretion system protein [Candidatus Andersenbacteria bacterium]
MPGYSLVELLITIAIIGILAAMVMAVAVPARNKAQDARIRNDIAQLRWEAEIVFDSQGASFENWTSHPTVTENVDIILADIDEALGANDAATVKDSDAATYCVSAPLVSVPERHYCIDAQGVFEEVSSPCPSSPPFECQI